MLTPSEVKTDNAPSNLVKPGKPGARVAIRRVYNIHIHLYRLWDPKRKVESPGFPDKTKLTTKCASM